MESRIGQSGIIFSVAVVLCASASHVDAAVTQQGLSQQGLSQQGLSQQGLSQQGLSQQGLSQQGLSQQGLSQQGLSQQGLSQQGVELQGLSQQGLSQQGLSQQGLSQQGLSQQGLSQQSVYVGGPDVEFGQRNGTQIHHVTLRGTTQTSADATHVMAVNATTSGTGTFIIVGGDSAVGHYAVAHMANASGNELPNETIDLYIASVQQDTSTNLFHEASMRSNADVWLYTVYAFHPMNRQWVSLCPMDIKTGAASAVAIAENPILDAAHTDADPNRFTFACTATGVDAKCARAWGYKPWRTDAIAWDFNQTAGEWQQSTLGLKPYYDACKIAARAAYCQDEKGFTKNGTLVDLYDTSGLVWSNTVESPNSQLMFAQEFNVAVAPQEKVADELTSTALASLPATQNALVSSLTSTALQRTRYRQLAPEPDQCPAFTWVDRLERDLFEDARWMSYINDRPRIVVLTPTYCGHSDDDVGSALAWDCNRCTTRVCADMPSCCDPAGAGWTQACVNKRHQICLPDSSQTESSSNPVFPRGIAIPAISDTGTPLRLLTGPVGAVETIEDGNGGIHIRGWACDPSAPGAHVRIRVYKNAPPGEPGSVDLTPRPRLADLPIDPAFASSIGFTCGDPAGANVNRMFDITSGAQLNPQPIRGKIFVYAEDAFAGLPGQQVALAPPTLLRNGIQTVNNCTHGEYTSGAALDSTCSACATKVCGAATSAYCCNAGDPRGWDDDCVLTASGDATAPAVLNTGACTAAESSAPVHAETFSVVRTGWLEPPATGDYTFCVQADDATRLWVNGQLLIDRWTLTPGHYCSSQVELFGGVKYHIRWDAFESNFLATARLTWLTPVAPTSEVEIPRTAIYDVYQPGASAGVTAEYFESSDFSGPSHIQREPTFGALPPPIAPGQPFSVRWKTALLAPATGDYSLVVVGENSLPPPNSPGGTPPDDAACQAPSEGGHGVCDLGAKLNASCSSCAATICQFDPFCCNGGYVSPYVTEPEWDTKCIAEVATLCGAHCPNELDPQRRTSHGTTPFSFKSGVKGHVEIGLRNLTAGPGASLQVLWKSGQMPLAPIGSDYVFSEATPQNAGTGFNAIYYNNNDNNQPGGITPDLANPATSRHEPQFQVVSSPGGPAQFPAGANLPSLSDAAAWVPPPPTVVFPASGSTLHDLNVHVTGFGIQFHGGSLAPQVQMTDPALGTTNLITGNAADASFSTDLTLAAGTHTLEFRSLFNYCSDPLGIFCSTLTSALTSVTFNVEPFSTSNRPPAPIVTDPTDPTHATSNQVHVAGAGLPGATITVNDEAVGADVGSTAADTQTGTFATNITLADGWHKLVFRQQVAGETSDPTLPVFVSVRVPPPIVDSPDTGTVFTTNQVTVSGEAGGSETTLGRVYVAEMDGATGVGPLNPGGWSVIDNGGTFTFTGVLTIAPGKHLLLVYQTTVADGLYPFVSAAATPTSRVEVDVAPPAPSITTPAPNTVDADGSLTVGGGASSAVPGADINVFDGPKTWTTSVLADGSWSLQMFLDPGWHDLTASQVVNSPFGGGWMESIRSALLSLGVLQPANAPTLHLPGTLQYEAVGPTGRVVDYSATATSTLPSTVGAAVPVNCAPPSPSLFALGNTTVHCSATDPGPGGGTAVDSFLVRIVDGPPIIIGAVDRTAEATDPFGADVSYNVTAEDVVSGSVPVSCAPISATHFALGFTTVTCDAFDGGHNHTTASFTVEVKDTTPPTVIPPADITVTGGPSGARVTFNPTASDLVDGPNVPVNCNPMSGSNFSVGTTPVSCTATDNHLNTSAPVTFHVTVVNPVDTTPPIVTVPADMNVTATTFCGTIVKFTASAVDAVDGSRPVTCKPASGTTFPLGTTTVTCSATDKSGNVGKASFKVNVTFSWSGFQPPINANGSSSFKKGTSVSVKFKLTGASAPITDLAAKLYVAKGGTNPALKGTFTYSRTDKTYCFNLATSTMTTGSWQLRIDMGDGVTRAVNITITP